MSRFAARSASHRLTPRRFRSPRFARPLALAAALSGFSTLCTLSTVSVGAALTAVAPALVVAGTAVLPRAAHGAEAAATLPMVAAEVRRIDAAQLRIVLKHGAIPNLDMPPMTMSFRVADAKLLAGLKVGDAVKFAAKMAGDDMVVVRLERAP